VDSNAEVSRTLGGYRPSWPVLATGTLVTGLFLLVQILAIGDGSSPARWVVISLLAGLLLVVWVAPRTTITREGVRLNWGVKRIAWTDVTSIYRPGPGNPNISIAIIDSPRRFVLDGVGPDKIQGIIALAEDSMNR
jgi:hypothetical protein